MRVGDQPWSALLVMHATVYRTFSEGLRQFAATVVGVTLAWAVGSLLGLDYIAMAVLLLLALLVGKVSRLRLNGTDVASTAVIILAVGYSNQDHMLVLRFLDTATGIVVGLVVNLLVWPPLRDRSAARAVDLIDDAVGRLLTDIAADLGDKGAQVEAWSWVERTREIDHAIEEAWGLLLEAHESGRLNPRRGARDVGRSGEFGDLLRRNEQAVAEIGSMARTLDHSISSLNEWDAEFGDRWIALLDEARRAIARPDSRRLTQVGVDLTGLAENLSDENLLGRNWAEYGALVVNLRNITASMDRVVELNPVVVSPARQRRFLLGR